ncbi:MAG: hypothetical protein ACLQVN_20220 [Bryobacteraceae bacterium]
MSFLDNLENNLKSLESREEGRDSDEREARQRAAERARVQAAAPYAEELRKSPFTEELLRQTTRVGHAVRTKIHVAWLGATLRLEARERRLELRPTASGVVAVSIEDGREVGSEPVDLAGDPGALLRAWLGV